MVKSCIRTVEILEYFSRVQRPATISDIMTALSIPQSSASSLVSTLVDMGVLSRLKNARYIIPTLRVSFLTHWTEDYHARDQKIYSYIKKFQDDIRETVILAMRHGIYSQYLAVEPAKGQTAADRVREISPGHQWPLIHSATGWSLLSRENDIETNKVINRSLLQADISSVKSTESLDPKLAVKEARSRGYAMSTGEATGGLAGIAAALPSFGEHPMLAVAIAGSRKNIIRNEKPLSTALMSLVKDMSQGLKTES